MVEQQTKKATELAEKRVHRNWVTLISYCQTTFMDGSLCFKVVSGYPVDLVEKHTKSAKRFKDRNVVHIDFADQGDEAEVIVMNVNKSWVALIEFCENSIPFGQICVKITNAEPTDLVHRYSKPLIRFDKPQTLPKEYYSFSAEE